MHRLTSIKRLAIAALATAGVVAACRAAQPREAPPLAPRPDIGPSTDPVPGAPDPLDPQPPLPGPTIPTNDAGPTVAPPKSVPVTQIDPPMFQSSAIRMQPGWDAQTGDAPVDVSQIDAARILLDAAPDGDSDADASPGGAPPRDGTIDSVTVRDAPPTDGRRVPRDGGALDAGDSGVALPPNPDAALPGDGARPLR